jgi:choline kinase
MKALMLAAGMGNRLSGRDETHHPKCLLRFDGQTLLQRHIKNLRALGVEQLVMVLGYRSFEIEAEIARLDAGDFVEFVENPRYRDGSVVSMWAGREVLMSGAPILFMDADVLYDPVILRTLIDGPGETCFPFDTSFEDGLEPVKFCLQGNRPVEFRKAVKTHDYDTVGEWVGFIRIAPEFAKTLASRVDSYVNDGRLAEPYEEAVRDLLLSELGYTVGSVDIAGKAWIEIDFPEDVARAETEILPRIGRGG